MKIGLRGGHSPNCIGAVGLLNEYYECQKIYKRVAELLRAAGHTVIDCNSNGYNANSELAEGTNKANANGVDFFASIHMNAGGGTGCEVWCYNGNSGMAISYGQLICKNISKNLGIENRGIKYSTGLHDLRSSNMQSMIIETLFCDSSNDCSKYDVEKLSRAIANAFDSSISLKEEEEVKTSVKGVVVFSNDPEQDLAIKLARKLGYAVLWSGSPCDYSVLPQENIWAIGGQRGSYTSYLLDSHFISGSNREDTLKKVADLISNL